MTGGSGLLGTALRKFHADILAPTHAEFDITDPKLIADGIVKYTPDVLLHAAAFTSPPKVNERPIDAMMANIVGTANVTRACAEKGVRLVYISTDYVFKGDRGGYAEEDELLPQNYYAWSKLGGECAVLAYANSLIIRTSFCPDVFPYEKAFIDQYTSRDSISVIAPMIYDLAIRPDVTGVIHVGTDRKSVKELAIHLGKKDVGDLRLDEVSFRAPRDTSFDLTKLHNTLKA